MYFPGGIYLLKVNKRNTRTRCEICSKLTLTSFLLTPETIFASGTIYQTHFKLTEIKYLRNVKKVHFAARTSETKLNKLQKSGNLNVN